MPGRDFGLLGALTLALALLVGAVTWPRPCGGYTLWLSLPGAPGVEPRWCASFAQAGVKVAPGRGFFGAAPAGAHARLSIACVDEGRIREACRRLGRVLAGAS